MALRGLVDYHVHTGFSGDSSADIHDVMRQASALGLKELCITDHIDFDYADPAFAEIDFKEYFRSLTEAAEGERYATRMLIGVEIGFQSHLPERLDALVQAHPFDFVICSTHMAEGLDFYTGDFFQGKNKVQAYDAYFAAVLEAVRKFKHFDVYGHLDAIARYGVYDDNALYYREHAEIIDAILRELIAGGKGIEINTSARRYGLTEFHPQADILKRYFALGGEIITVGSDAHRAKDVGADLAAAYALLRDIGFKRVATYCRRQPGFIEI
ncbi:MAG: histidinol-phosphatase HisJ family protein [Syntrophomonadaceae bacterium]|nr:histidinol-phosphatase HisJ family protein [Syntrophomonadaceae bacterium]